MIRMTHPRIGTQVDVHEDAVEAWASVGWLRPEPVEARSPSKAARTLVKRVPVELGTVTLPVTSARTKRPSTPRDDVR